MVISFDMVKLLKVLQDFNIDKSTKYIEFFEINGGVYDGLKMPKYPWTVSKKSVRQFFDELFPDRKENKHFKTSKYIKMQRKNLDEHLILIRKNNIFTETQYREFYKNNKLKLQGFYSVPWKNFNISCKKLFEDVYTTRTDYIYSRRSKKTKVSPLEHLQLILKHNLLGARKYRKFYLLNRHELDLLSRPWDRFGLTESDFFSSLREGKNLEPRGTLWIKDVKEQNLEEMETGS